MFVVIDYAALPPEINSARMYAGPGPGSLAEAAAFWDGLATELHSAARSYRSVIEGLTTTRWMGPSSLAMASAFGPYVAWAAGAGARAAETASQARLAVESYEAAFAMTVPPPAVTANRVQLASLIATNFLGQNTTAIVATEAEYGEMWAQDATAMYGYAAGSAEASTLTPFTSPPEVANPDGLATQSAQAGGSSASAAVQSTLSHLVSKVPAALQSLASPVSSTATTGGLGGTSGALSGFSLGGLAEQLVAEYADLAGFGVIFAGLDALSPVMNPAVFAPFISMASAAAAVPLAGSVTGAAQGALVSAVSPGLGSLAGLGQAAAVGGLTVPPSWGWAVAAPAGTTVAGVSLASSLEGAASGGVPMAAGLPLMMGGLPRSIAAGAVGGAVAAKYGPRLKAAPRSPAAGYSQPSEAPPPAVLPVTAQIPPPPPGYMAVVYMPTNRQAPADG